MLGKPASSCPREWLMKTSQHALLLWYCIQWLRQSKLALWGFLPSSSPPAYLEKWELSLPSSKKQTSQFSLSEFRSGCAQKPGLSVHIWRVALIKTGNLFRKVVSVVSRPVAFFRDLSEMLTSWAPKPDQLNQKLERCLTSPPHDFNSSYIENCGLS